jgi:hypothetical protein
VCGAYGVCSVGVCVLCERCVRVRMHAHVHVICVVRLILLAEAY